MRWTQAMAALFALAALVHQHGAKAAQDEIVPQRPVGANGNVPELGVGFGLVNSFGLVSSQLPANARSPGAGGAIELDPGWRVLPSLTVGAWGFGAQLGRTLAPPAAADVYEAGAGLQATLRFRPEANELGPWLALGSGWRGQWLGYVGDGTTGQHGLELVRARAGVDFHVSRAVALAPVVGASVAMFLTEEIRDGTWHAIPSPGLSTFVFLGARATVDFALHPPRP